MWETYFYMKTLLQKSQFENLTFSKIAFREIAHLNRTSFTKGQSDKLPDYSRLSILRFFAIYAKKCENNALKILTHSVAGCVTFRFDGCFVNCFRQGPSVIIQFKRPISNLLYKKTKSQNFFFVITNL